MFDSLDEAKGWCRQKVREIDALRCDVYDRRGKAVAPLFTCVCPRYERTLPNRRTARQVLALAWVLIAASAPLFWLDWNSGGALIVPTLLGFTLVGVGIRLLFWGYSDMAKARRREAEEAAESSNGAVNAGSSPGEA